MRNDQLLKGALSNKVVQNIKRTDADQKWKGKWSRHQSKAVPLQV